MGKKYVIVVEGTDGSGKSTIINAVTPLLESKYGCVKYEHLRPNYISSLGVALHKRTQTEEDKRGPVTDPHSLPPSGFLGSLFRLGYYMIDYTWGYYKKVYHSKDTIWIFDRYFYDFMLDQRRARLNLPNCFFKLCSFFVPKPDLILCLGGDPKKIYERKPETSLDEVTRQTNVLKRFCNKRKNAVWVDTTLEPEESIRLAKEAILDMLSKKFNRVTF